MRQFGERLPEFLKGTAPFSEHGILAEVAELECILLRAFDSADTARLSWPELQAIDMSQWPNMILILHPSVHFLYVNMPAWKVGKR